MSFVAEPGKTTAIIGSTGSGKTTLLGLMLRLFDPQSGSVTIDGQPVSALTRAQLASTLGLVPQRPYLFGGTIASNLRFGNTDASDEELWDALRVAQGEDFVREKDKGLDAVSYTHLDVYKRQTRTLDGIRIGIGRAVTMRRQPRPLTGIW